MIEMLLPKRCAACAAPGAMPLCAACDRDAPWIGEACIRCAHPGCPGSNSNRCDGRGVSFDAPASAGAYREAVRDALIAFKLLGERRAAAAMAERMRAAAARLPVPRDAPVTFVPAGRASMGERGFNPAATLAAAFARQDRRRCGALLRKTRRTPDLAGLDRRARRDALRDAFACVRPPPGGVILVDDVLTTGATGSACASTLKAAGAARIWLVTFARSL